MNKAELTTAVLETTELSRSQVDAVITAALEQIMVATAAGDKVVLAGFGTFEARDRAAREGRNPATGEALHIAASRGVGFKPAAGFKAQLAAGSSV